MSKKEKILYPPQRYKYCAKFSAYVKSCSCLRGNLSKIIFWGPEPGIVPFDDWCNKFRFHERYKSGQKTR